MNILMVTNTYRPLVGGVERSVEDFTEEFRRQGHRTIVVTPSFGDMDEFLEDVIRIPAVQNFNATDFSVAVPVPGYLNRELGGFKPDVVHSHHPFLLGDTGIRLSARFRIPLVYTFHTFHEKYTHYVPGDSDAMKEFIKRLAVEYANICDTVVAPSESVSNILSERGVDSDIRVIPTGIHTDVFASGDGTRFRKRFNIPSENCVAGFVSRIAPEKNLDLLCRGAAEFCARENGRTFVAVGDGPGTETVKRIMKEEGAADSLVMTGALEGEDLSDAYNAMDFFAFCSKTETQGLVVAEAMAAGLPVAALSAPGVREVMRDGHNGFIFTEEKPSALAQTLERLSQLSSNTYRGMSEEARESAREYSVDTCAHTMLDLYRELNESAAGAGERETGLFDRTRRRIESEWNMIRSKLRATGAALEEINPFQESRSS